MQLFNKLQEQYDNLWKHIIRPTRTTYPDTALGPDTFLLQDIKVKRNSFQLLNDRGFVFYGSHFVPLEAESYPCVIYLHGNSSNQTQGMEYLGYLIKNGISLCTFDFSGCGNSEGEYISLGYYEWKDVEEVFNYLKGKNKVTNIGLWGRSMGAVTALRFANRNPQIKSVVYDCPFNSLQNLIQDICKNNSKIPGFILSGALKIISKTIKEKANFSVYDLNPLKDDAPHIDIPGFFIVAESDQLIPPKHSKSLFEAYKCQKKQIKAVKGKHNSIRPEKCIKSAVKHLKMSLLCSKQEYQQFNQSEKQTNDIDFFNDIPQQKPNDKSENIDFFADEPSTQPMSKQQEQFNNFQFDVVQKQLNKMQESKTLKKGMLNDFFFGMFSGNKKENKQKHKVIGDKYQESRVLVSQLLNIKTFKQDQKIVDTNFMNLFEKNPTPYLWS